METRKQSGRDSRGHSRSRKAKSMNNTNNTTTTLTKQQWVPKKPADWHDGQYEFKLIGNLVDRMIVQTESIDDAVRIYYEQMATRQDWGLLKFDEPAISIWNDLGSIFEVVKTLGEVLDAYDDLNQDSCRICKNSTLRGSGRWINRVPSFGTYNEFRYVCADCDNETSDN